MIPVTSVHGQRIIYQVTNVLVNVQKAMNQNAQTHKAMALAETPPIEDLRTMMVDCATLYLRDLGFIESRRSGKGGELIDQIAKVGWADDDVALVLNALKVAALNYSFEVATIKDYAGVIAACDAVLAEVQPVDSLWNE